MAKAIKSLLVADDDPLVQATYKHCFEEAGYKTGIANDGREALAYLAENEVNTLFLDVFMPDKDGLETLLEAKKRFPGLRIVVMTGGGHRARFDFLSAAAKFGADGVVKKPISPTELIRMVETDSFPSASA
jgi:CheY-like chemotaxis protein